MKKVLIVEDEVFTAQVIAKKLEQSDIYSTLAKNCKEALNIINSDKPQVILLDYQLPDGDGLSLLKKIVKIVENVQVIMITAYGNIPNAVEAIKSGAYDFLEKKRDFDRIPIIVNNAFEKLELLSTLQDPPADLKAIEYNDEVLIGESSVMEKIKEKISIISPYNMSVFLGGETGTGKGFIAKLIHKNSDRQNNNFISVDCGAIPDSLFESEMFGHEKGSFTGALSQHKGFFERANGGTLFLDEISNLPLNLQTKLLRAIQERTIYRVGGEEAIAIDVRIISASNKDMGELIRRELFKDDLFYRINEINITIPPLRDRKNDIALLSNYFLVVANTELNKNIKKFSMEALNMLSNYDWPGNIRELKNIIKTAVLYETSDIIKPKNIHFSHEEHKDMDDNASKFSFSNATNNYKKVMVMNALSAAEGNKSKAAELLGISRRQLYRYLEEK